MGVSIPDSTVFLRYKRRSRSQREFGCGHLVSPRALATSGSAPPPLPNLHSGGIVGSPPPIVACAKLSARLRPSKTAYQDDVRTTCQASQVFAAAEAGLAGSAEVAAAEATAAGANLERTPVVLLHTPDDEQLFPVTARI